MKLKIRLRVRKKNRNKKILSRLSSEAGALGGVATSVVRGHIQHARIVIETLAGFRTNLFSFHRNCDCSHSNIIYEIIHFESLEKSKIEIRLGLNCDSMLFSQAPKGVNNLGIDKLIVIV